jgi:subtilase family serine protease
MNLLWAGALALAATPFCALAQGAGDRIAGPIDEARAVTLEGNMHPLARAEFDRGVLSEDTPLKRMVLELEPGAEQQAELDSLVEAQQAAGSAEFHQWLTPAEYGERFGVGAGDLARICGWLSGHGFEVEEIAASKRLVIFSGTAGQVAETFHTQIHSYLVDGAEHIANSQDPQIPAALAGVVGGVVSLHDFRRRSEMRARRVVNARPEYSAGSTHYLFPGDLAAIYDLSPLYSAGISGAGTGIAIVGRSNINLSDVAAFRATAELPGSTPKVILAGANPGLVAADQDESTLDVEWSGALAPAAAVSLVVGESTATTDGVDLGAQYAVNHATAPVVSVSYGSCEREMSATELKFYNGLWEQAASQGMSVFVASGDAGASDCSSARDAWGSGTSVNGMCSSPYATCVGGTELDEGIDAAKYWAQSNSTGYTSALSYIPEEVWNESASNGETGLWASGGGASAVYAQPEWQAGVSGTAGGMREVPDVALSAADHDGYFVWENGSFFVMFGTSAATPSFAGVMALVVQSKSGMGQGNANAGLYSLLHAERNPFHATPSGNNSVPGVPGFTADGAAYNQATGLGSVDGAVLVSEWGSEDAAAKTYPALTLIPEASEVVVIEGGQGAVSFTAATGGSFSGSIGLQVSGLPAGVTAGWTANPIQSASGVSSKTTTLTLTVGAGVRAGTVNVVVTAAGDGLTASRNMKLQVEPIGTPRSGPVGLPCSLCDRPRPLLRR